MINPPLVSVLMTAYNREKYITEAIKSVLVSTYTNFELIIVDDGSVDGTVNIARSFESIDHRIRVYINETNLGDYPNRNKAASYANGKYIKYLDADDYLYPWGLEIVVKCMEENPDAGYGLDSIEQDQQKPFPFLLTPSQAYYRNFFQKPTFHKSPTSCIIKTEIFKSENGFSGKWMVGDYEMWLKLSKNHSLLLMPMGVVWSRIHEEQESTQIRRSSLVVFRYSVVSLENIQSNDCPLTLEERRNLIFRIRKSQSRSVMRSLVIERDMRLVMEKMSLSNLSPLKILYYIFKNSE